MRFMAADERLRSDSFLMPKMTLPVRLPFGIWTDTTTGLPVVPTVSFS